MTRRKQKKIRLGEQPPQYRFFLNPYQDLRWTMCPQCGNKMHQRKLPLVIHVDPIHLLSLNKTCRYCLHCDLLIAHQNDIEHFLASILLEKMPEIIGNDYLVIGTLDKAAWKRATQQYMTTQETFKALHDFKEFVTFKVTGGWVPTEAKTTTKKRGHEL